MRQTTLQKSICLTILCVNQTTQNNPKYKPSSKEIQPVHHYKVPKYSNLIRKIQLPQIKIIHQLNP